MVKVGRRYEPSAHYIGRGSPLGNPFTMKDESERDSVCDQYKVWFYEQVALKNVSIVNELHRLMLLAEKGDLLLGCYCSPKRCHGDTIKEYLDKRIEERAGKCRISG